MKADEATVARSLRGNWRDEHLFALAQALERYDFLARQIEQCEGRVMATMNVRGGDDAEERGTRTSRERRLRLALRAVLGVDLTAIPTIGVETALTLASEIGADLSRFPSGAALLLVVDAGPGHAH